MDARLLKLSEVSQKDKYCMTSVICGIQNIAQMNLCTKQRKTHRHRDRTCGCQGGGEKEEVGNLGLVDAIYNTENG